jgi:hypothetical protein
MNRFEILLRPKVGPFRSFELALDHFDLQLILFYLT